MAPVADLTSGKRWVNDLQPLHTYIQGTMTQCCFDVGPPAQMLGQH